MSAVTLSVDEARRIAVRAQLLAGRGDGDAPHRVLDTVARLGAVQVDQTAYVAPNAELVVWSRLGSPDARRELAGAVAARQLVEYLGFLRPAADIDLFRAEMAAWPELHPPSWHTAMARWVEDNDAARIAILAVLTDDGPLTAAEVSRDLPAGVFAREWRSSGWNNAKNVPMMLERMGELGQVAVAHRFGRERSWDLAERVFPPAAAPRIPLGQAVSIRAERRLAALGIARRTGPACQTEPVHVGTSTGAPGVEARIDGVRGTWQVDPVQLDRLGHPFRPRTALLSPLDRLVFDRARMAELFAFEYALEMYKPARARRWGYFALPVLHGERLVGKVDVEADRRADRLRVHAVHRDERWTTALAGAVDAELASLADFLELELELDRAN